MTVAALGALVMSSGVALLVTTGPANAANKVGICHATSSDSNPYTFVSVDDDSAKLKGHLAHRQTPNKTWKNAGVFNGVPHAAGDPKPDLIGSFTDDEGVFHAYDGTITASSCEAAVVVVEATADVDFEDPTCANANTASYDTIGEHVTFAVHSGSVAPGQDVVIRATAVPPAVFDGGDTFKDFAHTFGPAVDLTGPPCVIVVPSPDTATAAVTFADPTCANASTPSYVPTGEHVTFAVHSGSVAPGQDVVIRATAVPPAVFDGGDTFKDFAHTFGPAVDLTGPPCVIVVPSPDTATAAVTFADPTCANASTPSYDPTGEHVTFSVFSGSVAAGQDVVIRATAVPPAEFEGGAPFKDFPYTFGAAVDLTGPECVNVEVPETPITPIVEPPVGGITPGTTPTVVAAGLGDDLRSERGQALVAAGAVMLLAGAAGLRRTRTRVEA